METITLKNNFKLKIELITKSIQILYSNIDSKFSQIAIDHLCHYCTVYYSKFVT